MTRFLVCFYDGRFYVRELRENDTTVYAAHEVALCSSEREAYAILAPLEWAYDKGYKTGFVDGYVDCQEEEALCE